MSEQMPLFCQRWRRNRSTYVPGGTTLDTRLYDVEPITRTDVVKGFLAANHYLGSSFPSARYSFGLYKRGEHVGVAVYGNAPSEEVLARLFPGDPSDSVAFNRLVLLPQCEANAESWFTAECMRRLRREGLVGCVTFADRSRGHIGTVYQACSFRYLGQTDPYTAFVWVDDGTELHRRALTKLRAGDRGWAGVARRFTDRGAPEPPASRDGRLAWLGEWLPRLTRPMRRPAKLRYAVAIDPAARKELSKRFPEKLPYPKLLPSADEIDARRAAVRAGAAAA